jgi:hypothetical protein
MPNLGIKNAYSPLTVLIMLKLKTLHLPAAWTSYGDGFEFNVDTDAEGCAFGSINGANSLEYAAIMKQRISANAYSGKRIKMVGYCRSEGVTVKAGIYLRTERLNGRPLTEDDMLDRPLVGSVDWQRYEMVIDVPAEATCIAIGAYLQGRGQVWFKELRFEEVAPTVSTTDQYAFGCVGIWDLEPVNLDFTEDEHASLREGRPYISEARRWVISWEPNGPAYEMFRPTDVTFNGSPTACVRPVGKSDCGYLYQHFAAARYRGKRVRYSLFIKTKRARLGASLFAGMFDTDNNDILQVMKENPVTGTKDWTKREREFDVPIDAYVIDFGAVLLGPGEMCLGGLKFVLFLSFWTGRRLASPLQGACAYAT